MAELVVDVDSVTVQLSAAEKLESLHSDVTVPRSSVTSARVAVDGIAEVHGLRAPGTSVPGVLVVGTFHAQGRRTFAVCHRRRPAVVLELTGQAFDRLVVTVDAPQAVVDRLV